MQDAKDDPTSTMQVKETLSEKRSRASAIRWTREKALSLGLQLLEAEKATIPATKPERPPVPTNLEDWQTKIREKLWEGLLASDDRVLTYLTKLLDIENQGDLRMSDDEVELIKRHRKWQALPPDEQHQELEKNFAAVGVLPAWRLKWRWNSAIQAWVPRQETYRCPECGEVLYEYSAPESTLETVTGQAPTPANVTVEAARSTREPAMQNGPAALIWDS